MNHELADVQAGYRKGRGIRDQIVNICWIMEKAREFHKYIYFCFIDYAKAFDCVDHSKLWNILKEMGIADHQTWLLRNLYAGQEATFRTGQVTTDCFQVGKRVHQGCILSLCLCNLYAECIKRSTGLEEAQAGIKIAGKNINKLRYADDTTIMTKSEEELKSLLMKVKEESEKVGLNLNIQKAKFMTSGPITSWQVDGETVETVAEFTFLGSKITADGDCSHEIKGSLLLGSRVMTNLDSILKSRDSVGNGGVIWENGIETCIISFMKRIASPGLMLDTGCLDWCTGMTQRDGMGREVGGGYWTGNTCTPVAG